MRFSFNLFILFSRHHIPTFCIKTHNSSNRSDEGLTLEKSAFLLFAVANLRFQLSC